MAATARSPISPNTAASADLTAAMANVSLSPPANTASTSSLAVAAAARSTSVRLSVPLDAKPDTATTATRPTGTGTTGTTAYPVRRLARRDSMERREALLKGNEGSRQRRRWENDRLLSNPWACPPLPSDWEVRPTYPRRSVPYYLAPLWDAAEFQRAVEAKLRGGNGARKGSMRSSSKRGGKNNGSLRHPGMSPMEEAAAAIPKEVKARLKRSKTAKGLLQDLEEEVRRFVREWNERELKGKGTGEGEEDTGKGRQRSETLDSVLTEDSAVLVSEDEDEDEDDEIVFVGRNGTMHDGPSPSAKEKTMEKSENQDALQAQKELLQTISREKLVFDSFEHDKGASFARWLVHCVGSYYGLRTWSVTKEVEDGENRREAYVGIDERATGLLGRGVEVGREVELPRPLWGMV